MKLKYTEFAKKEHLEIWKNIKVKLLKLETTLHYKYK